MDENPLEQQTMKAAASRLVFYDVPQFMKFICRGSLHRASANPELTDAALPASQRSR